VNGLNAHIEEASVLPYEAKLDRKRAPELLRALLKVAGAA
jgi:hypothetical protein